MAPTQEYVLRAMAVNYAGGHSWDHLDGEACSKAADEIAALRAGDGYRAAWLEMVERCNVLKEENYQLRHPAQGSAHPSVRECLKEWIEQGYIDADGEHCGSAAYAPAVYKRSVAALAAEEEPRGLGEEAIREAAESTAVGAQIVRREGDLLVCYSGFNLSRFVRYLALSVPSAHRGGEA